MEEKKEKAVEKAREYFHQYGYRGSSLSSLIAEIGISKPTFYNYFKNKEELFHTVMLETWNEFQYQFNQRARGASNAMEKLDYFITTWEWFLDTFPLFRDLFKPDNDLLTRWTDSRHAKDFFYEGVETVRSIIEQGREEGIFAADVDAAECAQAVYYLVMVSLSTDPNIFRKSGQPPIRITAKTLVSIVGRGILSRDAL
ncbi:MAG TPA: TetR/AcrR family transcriptional regulator [Spirochaetia bacterium]